MGAFAKAETFAVDVQIIEGIDAFENDMRSSSSKAFGKGEGALVHANGCVNRYVRGIHGDGISTVDVLRCAVAMQLPARGDGDLVAVLAHALGNVFRDVDIALVVCKAPVAAQRANERGSISIGVKCPIFCFMRDHIGMGGKCTALRKTRTFKIVDHCFLLEHNAYSKSNYIISKGKVNKKLAYFSKTCYTEKNLYGGDRMSSRVEEKLHTFLNSRLSLIVYTALACLAASFSLEQYATPIFVIWLMFILVFEKSFLNAFLLFTLICGNVLRTLGQTSANLSHIWLALPIVVGILLAFILHGKLLRPSRLFISHLGVSLALLLGGVGRISPANYFKIDALYYVLVLGLGMSLFYYWFRFGVSSNAFYDCRERLMESLYCVGVFCAYNMIDQAIRLYFSVGDPLQGYLWANDIADMMLFAIPAVFYFARRNYLHVLVALAFAAVMVLSVSLSALLVCFLLLIACFAYLIVYRKKQRWLSIVLLSLFVACGTLVLVLYSHKSGGLLAGVAEEENGRFALIKEAWHNFLSYPILGVGIGQPGCLTDFFMGINWTHNLPLQVLGSMGIVGALAFGYQAFERIRILFRRRDAFHMACALLYLGLLMISMLQPGEFSPLPYAMMTVMIFVVLEASDEEATIRSDAKKEEKTDFPS